MGEGRDCRDRSFYKKVDEQKSVMSNEKQRKHQTYFLMLNKVKCERMNSFHLGGLTGKPYFQGGEVEGLIYDKVNMKEFVYNEGFQRSYWECLKDKGTMRLGPGLRKLEQ